VLGSHWRILNRKVTGHDVHFNNSSGCCVETGLRETAETGRSVQEREDGGLKCISCGTHEKWWDSGYILNLQQSEFANGFVVTCEKEKTEC